MAKNEPIDRAAGRNRTALIALAVLLAIGSVILYMKFRSPPQMGTSDDVFKMVDALYTAVRNEDEKQLGRCEQRLRSAHEAGKLPGPAWDYLHGVIDTARAGRWRPATASLYEFMLGQRREGPIEHAHDPKKKKTPREKG